MEVGISILAAAWICKYAMPVFGDALGAGTQFGIDELLVGYFQHLSD